MNPHEQIIHDKLKTDFVLPQGEIPTPLIVQKYALINIANTHSVPKCHVPSLRVVDASNSEDALRTQCDALTPLLPDCNFYVIPTHQLFILAEDSTRQTDDSVVRPIIDKHVAQHMKKHKERDEVFNKRIRREIDDADLPQPSSASVSSPKTQPERSDHVKEVPAGVSALKFVVLGVVDSDPEHANEPCLSIFALFETLAEAEFYSKHTASHQYPLLNIYIVQSQKWVSPEKIDFTLLKEVHRNTTVDDIFVTKREEDAKIKELEAQHAASC